MIHIRRLQDVIDLAYEHAPSNACQAAMRSPLGKITFLGSFTAVEGFPGWIIEVRSLYETSWLIAICVNELDRKYLVRYIVKVPWETWAGERMGRIELRDGDNPPRFALERMKARATKKTNPR